MANLTETTTYDAGIYQLEQTDAVDAGTSGNGVSNLQAKGLANRTNYLKSHVDILETYKKKYSGVVIVTGDTTLTSSDYGKLYVVAGSVAAVTFTLPAIGAGHEGYAFAFENKSSYAVNINRAGSDTIDGTTTKQLAYSGDSLELVVDESATNFVIKGAVLKVAKYSNEFALANLTTSTTTYADVTGLTYTTPNDGVTRKYLITFESAFNYSSSAGNGAEAQVLSGATQIAYQKNYMAIETVGVDSAHLGINCGCVVSVGPNVIIKAQIKNAVSASCNYVNSKLIIVEL